MTTSSACTKLRCMKTCTKCREQKDPTEFSWTDRAHRWRDSQCRTCRARIKRKKHIPRRTTKPAVFPRGLHANVCDHISESQLAYLAGLIDGEGCITSSYPRATTSPLTLTICMVHKPTIDWVKATVGGGVVAHRTKQTPVRQSWSWQIKGIRTFALLRRTLPFMQTKREEAEVAIRFGETFFADQISGRITTATHELRCQLGQQLRDLKRQEWK